MVSSLLKRMALCCGTLRRRTFYYVPLEKTSFPNKKMIEDNIDPQTDAKKANHHKEKKEMYLDSGFTFNLAMLLAPSEQQQHRKIWHFFSSDVNSYLALRID